MMGEKAVTDCHHLPHATWYYHLTEDKKANLILSKSIHILVSMELLKSKVSSHEFQRSALIHTLTSGLPPCSFHKKYSNLPKSFLSAGSGTGRQARSKILTLHTASRSHHVSFRNKVPLFPPSFCRCQSLLARLTTNALMASPRRMHCLLLALKRCSKDQNNKIK